MKVLILGSHGCIGRAVSRFFKLKGEGVIEWDIKMGLEYDLRIPNILDTVLPTVDFVLFLAFDVGGSKYNINSLEYINNNVLLMNNTFNSIAKFNKPFIHTTSMMSNMNNNPYAVLKRLGEFYTRVLDGISVKLWNVYGSEPITEKSHVIPDFINQAINTDVIQMRTSGEEERLFLYCNDFSKGLYDVYKNYDKFKGTGEIDISTREWISIKEVAETIKEIVKEELNKDIEIKEGIYIDNFHNRKNQPTDSYLDKIWKADTSLKDGIKGIVLSMIKAT